MQYRAVIIEIAQRLVAAGIEEAEARSMARLLLSYRLDLPLSRLTVYRGELETETFAADVERLCAGEPLQYVVGETEFMGLPLLCRPGVLIPRCDSEPLAERALKLLRKHPAPLIADVCCGSGAYGLSLLHHLPRARAILTDISPQALALTRDNAAALGLSNRVTLAQGDLLEPLQARTDVYDLIICNPPYVRHDEIAKLSPQVKCEPTLALDGGEDGMDFYRRLIPEITPLLAPQGYLLLEHGKRQRLAICRQLSDNGLRAEEFIYDLGRRPRGVLVRRKLRNKTKRSI